jgi:uncharacterized protein (TIGR00297 family)
MPSLNFSALAVTVVFALGGYFLRGVSRSGAVTGCVLAYAIYVGAGRRAFIMLVALFVLTFLATRLGRRRKLALGTAERSDGRSASQVLANVGVASLFAIGYGHFGHPSWLAGCAAALAEAAADTVSSEYGQVFGAPARLLTTGGRVPVGTNGGISLAGTLSGTVAAIGIAMAAVMQGLVDRRGGWVVAVAAVIGMFVDSLFGAVFEGPGGLNNDAVNFLATLSAALLGCWWSR